MKCPYCVSEIPHQALVCATCRRDLYIVKPLLARIAELEAQLATRPLATDPAQQAEAQLVRDFDANEAKEDQATRSIGKAILWWTLPLALLILGHWLMFFVYDTKVLYLRLYALIIPLPFGFLFARALRGPFVWGLLPAVLMATLAVFAMGGVTSLIDHVPLLPDNMQDVRELLEFSTSIGLSFITGLWLCDWQMRRDERKRLNILRAGLHKMSAINGKQLTEKITRLNDLGSGAVALMTTALALYTGLQKILG